jgi:hypothetical protein
MSNRYELDEKTGYMQSVPHYVKGLKGTLTAENKAIIITAALEYLDTYQCYPPLLPLAKLAGVNLSTLNDALKSDPAFSAAWNEVKARIFDCYRKKLADKADRPNGVIANLAILKYQETGAFSEAKQWINSQLQSQEAENRVIIDIEPELPSKPAQIERKERLSGGSPA